MVAGPPPSPTGAATAASILQHHYCPPTVSGTAAARRIAPAGPSAPASPPVCWSGTILPDMGSTLTASTRQVLPTFAAGVRWDDVATPPAEVLPLMEDRFMRQQNCIWCARASVGRSRAEGPRTSPPVRRVPRKQARRYRRRRRPLRRQWQNRRQDACPCCCPWRRMAPLARAVFWRNVRIVAQERARGEGKKMGGGSRAVGFC